MPAFTIGDPPLSRELATVLGEPDTDKWSPDYYAEDDGWDEVPIARRRSGTEISNEPNDRSGNLMDRPVVTCVSQGRREPPLAGGVDARRRHDADCPSECVTTYVAAGAEDMRD